LVRWHYSYPVVNSIRFAIASQKLLIA
jgi:hypothetical protein